VLTYLAIAFALTAVLVRLFVPGMIVARARRQIAQGAWQVPLRDQPQSRYSQTMQGQSARFIEQTGDAGQLSVVFQTRTIVAGALLEGAAFFALISYLLGRSP